MPKVTVDIDKNQVDKWAKDRISELENDLARALQRERRRNGKIAELELKIEDAEKLLAAFGNFVKEIDNIRPLDDIFEFNYA